MLLIQQTFTANSDGYILSFGSPGNLFTSVILNWSTAISNCGPLSALLSSSRLFQPCQLLPSVRTILLFLSLFSQSIILLDFGIPPFRAHSPSNLIPHPPSSHLTHTPTIGPIQPFMDAPQAEGLSSAAGEDKTMQVEPMTNL